MQLDDKVMIHSTGSKLMDETTGTILGTSMYSPAGHIYIVMLDTPLSTRKAITLPETCLRRIS